MDLFECVVGQRVVHKETNKPATIKALWRAEGEVEIEFDNSSRLRVNPKLLSLSDGPGATRVIKRPCPQCGADMGDAPKCAKCSFEYRQPATAGGLPLAYTLLISVAVVAVIGFVVWKFVLGGKLP